MRALAVLLLASCTSTAGDADDTDTDSDGVVDGTDTDPVDTGTYDGAKDTLPPPTVAFDAVTATLGSPDTEVGRTPGEATREVTLTRSFVVMAFEVSQARYAAWTDGAAPSAWGDCPNCPVERVTWHEAVAFANAQSEADGLDACYTCTPGDDGPTCRPVGSPYACEGWRLPTEAEWEGAARGGEEHAYPGSDNVRSVAWFEDNASNTTHVGCSKTTNGYNLCDMAGNVSEWVHDRTDLLSPYPGVPTTDPVGAQGSSYLFRGGPFTAARTYQRTADRFSINLGQPADGRGIRLVRSKP